MRSALLFLLGTMALLKGQGADTPATPPMPPGPPIELRAPDHSQWTITLAESTPSPAGATTPVPDAKKNKVFFGSMYTLTKTGKIMCRQTLDDQNRPWVTWCLADLQLTVYPDHTMLAQPRPPDVGFPNPYYVDYAQTDFPDFWWISAKNFAGLKSQSGKQCLYFKDNLKFYRDDNSASSLEAYVDVKTRYPVLLIINGTTSHAYTFLPPPESDLELPDPVRSLLKQRAQTEQTAMRRTPVL